MTSRASTPDYSPRLSPEQEFRRMAAPQDYPCYTENGYYQPTWGCKEKCCIVPAVTPEGEDSPKWSATLAARMEDKEPMQQPYFGCNTPPKTVLLKDYDPNVDGLDAAPCRGLVGGQRSRQLRPPRRAWAYL